MILRHRLQMSAPDTGTPAPTAAPTTPAEPAAPTTPVNTPTTGGVSTGQTPTFSTPGTTVPDPDSGWQGMISTLPQELQQDTYLQGVGSFEELVKQFSGQQQVIGKKGIILPDANNPDDVARFRKEIGVPDSPDGYDLSGFTPPEDMEWSSDVQNGMVAVMHEEGLQSGTVSKLMGAYAELQRVQKAAFEQQVTAQRDSVKGELVKEWGGEEKFNARHEHALRAVNQICQESGIDINALNAILDYNGQPIGNNPTLIKLFATVGAAMSDHALIGGKLSAVSGHTPSEATTEINKLRTNADFMQAYMDGAHPEHGAAVSRMRALHRERDGVDLVPDAPQFR